jgi:hypothetical protein
LGVGALLCYSRAYLTSNRSFSQFLKPDFGQE